MFRLWLLALLLPVMPAVLSAQAPTKTNPDYSKEAFVYDQYIDKFKFEDNGTYTRETTARIRIQSDAGVQHFSILMLPYESASQSVTIDHIRVRKLDGSAVDTPMENIQDMPSAVTREAPFYSDVREKQVAVKGLGAGDVLEYQVRWDQTKPLVPGQFWLEYAFDHESIVLDQKLEVSLPRDRAIKLKSEAVKPVVEDTGAVRTYKWASSNLAHKTDQEEKLQGEANLFRQAAGRILPPDIQFSTFQTWDEIGRWYAAAQQDRVKPSPEIQAKAAELTKGAPDDAAKIHALYNYVSLQFHYIAVDFGIGRYQPHYAAEVLNNQYGDCKDKHTLLAALLAAAGIKAYPALISIPREIDPDVPSPGQFDHVITVVPQGEQYIWLDTTAEVAPFAYLLPPLRSKHALVIEDDKAALMLTPESPFPSLHVFRIEAKLGDDGVLEGKTEQTLRGDREFAFRRAFRSVPLPQWNQLVQGISQGQGFAGDVADATASSPENTGEPFHLSYHYKRKDYPDWKNHQISPPLPIITLPTFDDDVVNPPVPIWLGSPGEIDLHAQVEFPKGYTPDPPPDVHLKTAFADFDVTYTAKGNVLVADRKLTIKTTQVPIDEYDAYKKFTKTIESDYNAYTTVSLGNGGEFDYQREIWRLPYSAIPEAARDYDQARAEFEKHNPQGEIESLKSAVKIDPKFTRAWLWLGEIYKSTRQADLAVEADRKAIAVDPQAPLGYKVLGFTLVATQKYEEAIPVWQEFSKLTPSDVVGPANLAGVFMSLKRYPEAIAAYESALKIDPDRPVFQFFIGRACLLSGDERKGEEAFHQAIGQKPEKEMLNSISYELADANKDLQEALDYAQKAVQQEEDASGKIQLSNLQTEDLSHAFELAAFWDTMGWVQFRLGKLEEAEKYLKAAWDLSLGSVEADHLGQVYLQGHKNAAAIRMYRLALATRAAAGPSFDFAATRKRLKQLGVADNDSLPNLNNELNQRRTIRLPRLVDTDANAEFFVVFSPDPKAPGWRLEDSKFISGDPKLKLAAKALSTAKFDVLFPDNGSERILRRGILGCYSYTGCSFVFLDPRSVNSIN